MEEEWRRMKRYESRDKESEKTSGREREKRHENRNKKSEKEAGEEKGTKVGIRKDRKIVR